MWHPSSLSLEHLHEEDPQDWGPHWAFTSAPEPGLQNGQEHDASLWGSMGQHIRFSISLISSEPIERKTDIDVKKVEVEHTLSICNSVFRWGILKVWIQGTDFWNNPLWTWHFNFITKTFRSYFVPQPSLRIIMLTSLLTVVLLYFNL